MSLPERLHALLAYSLEGAGDWVRHAHPLCLQCEVNHLSHNAQDRCRAIRKVR